jgi:PKD repeat protein
MSLDSTLSMSLDISNVTLPTRDYPINYGGNYISDVMDKYSLGHFADGVVYTDQDDGLSFLPYADFSATPLKIFAGSSVQFINLSKYGNSYTWEFGDSTTPSNALNPVHVYNVIGKHTVSLTTYSKWNYANTNTKSEYIEVIAQPDNPVVADFVGNPIGGNIPMLVTFTNNSTNADSYEWNFGDGSTSALENPTHTYNVVGVYTVSLIAKLGNISNSKVRQNYITIGNAVIPTPPPDPPTTGIIEVVGGGGCVLPGTKIKMADGTVKNAENIILGDILYSTNGETVVVQQLLPNRFDRYNILNGRLKITYEHPVLVVRNGKKELVQVEKLLIGDKLVRYNNTIEVLYSNIEIFENTPTYNFVVNGDHMYVAEDIFVHNASSIFQKR